MKLNVRLKVIDDAGLRSRMANTGIRAQAWAEETAENILQNARDLMDEPKTGRQYPTLPNRSSAPGQAPARQSGRLYRSGEAEGRGMAVRVAFDTEYATYLEFGTSRMAPRPFLRPAVEAEQRAAIARARKIVEG